MPSGRLRAPARTLPALLLLLGTLALFGCAAGRTPGPCDCALREVFDYPLVVGNGTPFAPFDPNLAQDTASRTVASLLYDGLVVPDPQLQMEDWGAQQVAVSLDGRTYTFHLRPNQAFVDGSPVTATDYAYSINRALNPCLTSPFAPQLFAIKDAAAFNRQGCDNGQIADNTSTGQTGPPIASLLGDSLLAADPTTLVIILAHPSVSFLMALTTPVADALDPKLVGANTTGDESWTATLNQGSTGQGTSGMFSVKKVQEGVPQYTLVANPHWWGLAAGKKPYLTEIDFTVIRSATMAYQAYQAGQFHMAVTPADLVASAHTDPNFHAVATLTYNGLSFNWTKPPFNNLDARQAFCLAINRDSVNRAAYNNTDISRWSIIPQGMPGYNPSATGPDGVSSTTGDTTAASDHWAVYRFTPAGIATPTISYTYDSDDPSATAAAQTLQGQWQQALGVQIVLRGESHDAWQQDVQEGNYDIAPVSVTFDYPDPQNALSSQFLHATEAQWPDVPAADTLMARADASSDAPSRLRDYDQAQQLLINNVATCPLFQGQEFYQVRACIHNWSISPNGLAPLDTWIGAYVIPSACPNA